MTRQNKNGNGTQKPLALVSPLDWGLGHTIRCIPLIRALQHENFDVVVACNSTQKRVLAAELQTVRFVLLEGYSIKYGLSAFGTRLSIISQLPKILTQINKENQWLRRFLSENTVDMIVSDNRYGFFDTRVPSVFITHQLAIRTGFGKIIDVLVQRRLYRYINRFTECWVPDIQRAGVAGVLSHPSFPPSIPVRYIGLLSRFVTRPAATDGDAKDFRFQYCIILSGPEPQRTVLEKIVLDELAGAKVRALLVKGLAAENTSPVDIKGCTVVNYATGVELEEYVMQSEYIICRAGYTSVMELLSLRKKMIPIPTPGQGEQEYVSKYLEEKKLAIRLTQNEFSFDTIKERSQNFAFARCNNEDQLLPAVVKAFKTRVISGSP